MSRYTWHHRLGHPANQVLNFLSKELNINSDEVFPPCEICHKAKKTREPFPISTHKTTNVGDVVHLDVWGPYRITSRDGFRFFLTIVDDVSRAVWVYLLKNKSKVSEYIISFYKMFQTQFSVNIKNFRSDNGTEFVNHKLQSFFDSKGVLHQTSCSYTPQQNGVAERKHRHLLNVARSLLFQGGIPLYFVTDCILTPAHLINRLPSSVLKGKSPFEVLFGFKPCLNNLRCFGCLCFATILNNSDKLSSRATKSVLIGYATEKRLINCCLWKINMCFIPEM